MCWKDEAGLVGDLLPVILDQAIAVLGHLALGLRMRMRVLAITTVAISFPIFAATIFALEFLVKELLAFCTCPMGPSAASQVRSTQRCSQWMPVLIVKNRPRETPETPRTIPGGVWCILITPAAQKVANRCIKRIYGAPSDPEIHHVAPAAAPAANLGPGTRPEPAATTHGGYGRNSTGGWLADDPQGVPPRPRMCGGGGATRAGGKRGGRAGRPARWHRTSIPAPHACPHGRHRVGRNQDRTTQPTFKARLPVCHFQFAC
jgi:hypothetical protein